MTMSELKRKHGGLLFRVAILSIVLASLPDSCLTYLCSSVPVSGLWSSDNPSVTCTY
jgi:hypothetical protein